MNDLFSPPENPRAVVGGNHPPPYDPDVFAACEKKTREFADAGGEWLDLPEIETEEQAQALADFISGARGVFKEVDEARKAQNRPHDEAIDATNKAFRGLTDAITKMVEKLKPKQAAYLQKKQDEARKEQERLRAEAEAARKLAAEQAAAAAARNDVMAEAEAERLAKEAERLAKEAAREVKANIQSASGGGRTMSLREVRSAEITNWNQVYMHFREDPRVKAVLQACADEAYRAKGGSEITIPGTKMIVKKVAA